MAQGGNAHGGLSAAVSRRSLLKMGAATAGALAAPIAAPAVHVRAQQPTGEVVVSLKNGIIAQDPTLTGSVSDIAVNFQHYETLIDQPVKAGEFVPVLAESWSNPDEL